VGSHHCEESREKWEISVELMELNTGLEEDVAGFEEEEVEWRGRVRREREGGSRDGPALD